MYEEVKKLSLKVVNYLERDIWRVHSKKLPRGKSFFIRQARMLILAVREFYSNKCQLSASALTFYTLLSVVPIVAMAFGIAKGFGLEKLLEKQILERFPGQEVTLTQIIAFANNLLENTKGGLIAGIGVIVLFWTVVKVLESIEDSFNEIWGVKKGRSMARKISDYLAIMLICPFLVITSSGVTVFLGAKIGFIVQKLAFLGPVGALILLSLHALPYVMAWVLFTFIYIVMPNTKVDIKSGIMGGIVAGTIYQVVQSVYVAFQVGVSSANAIYGSFAALPLFLIWLQMSWRIVLFGTEVSFAHQNVDTYEFEDDCANASYAFKKLSLLYIVSVLSKRFAAGEKPLSASQIADLLGMPIRLVRDVLFELVEAGIVAEVKGQDFKQLALYQPGMDINLLTAEYVIAALENKGVKNLPVTNTKELERLVHSLETFEDLVKKSPANKLLKDI